MKSTLQKISGLVAECNIKTNSAIQPRTLKSLIFAILLTGCTTGHVVNDKVVPDVAINTSFSIASEVNTPEFDGFTQSWWKNFERPELNQLVDESLSNSQDIAQAVARLKLYVVRTFWTSLALA